LPNQSGCDLIPDILICARRFAGRDFSSMRNAMRPCRHAMTVCFGVCTRRRASVLTVNSPSRVTATIRRGSATARANAIEARAHLRGSFSYILRAFPIVWGYAELTLSVPLSRFAGSVLIATMKQFPASKITTAPISSQTRMFRGLVTQGAAL
jgi:hypothetical protein